MTSSTAKPIRRWCMTPQPATVAATATRTAKATAKQVAKAKTTKTLATTTTSRIATKSKCHTHELLPTTRSLTGRRSRLAGVSSFRPYPRHLLAYCLITTLFVLCWLPDFIVALKDVSVTIPQAVKRGSNAMLTCNYDMENDTLYSVKWYKGRREFYRYTPKENPAMKVFPSQSGLSVERNLSNQSHVVLLAVPLNISGKFTCEISVDAPSFQTAMVSGEMEVVELPEEQASVTGIQPRYRIGDLVDGNCSIKYSKPAANLTWTINGIVVPPHHIKTYQIEKYEETNLESVMSAIHFMVTTQHFIKGQMRLKCAASIFDIFKEEIESVIEEDRPRIMASGRSYDAHSYPHDNGGEGYEDHNESYLTYFSAPKSSASRMATAPFSQLTQNLHKLLQQLPRAIVTLCSGIKTCIDYILAAFIKHIENCCEHISQSDVATYCCCKLQWQLIKLITLMAVALRARQVPTYISQRSGGKKMLKAENNCKSCEEKKSLPGAQESQKKAAHLRARGKSCQYMQRPEQMSANLLHILGCETLEALLCLQQPWSYGKLKDVKDANSALAADKWQLHAVDDDDKCLAANQNNISHIIKKATNEQSAKSQECQRHHMSQTLAGPSAKCSSPSSLSAMASFQSLSETCQLHISQKMSFSANIYQCKNAKCTPRKQTLLMTASNKQSARQTCISEAITSSSNTSFGAETSVLNALEYATSSHPAARQSSSTEARTMTAQATAMPRLWQTVAMALKLSNSKCMITFIGAVLLHQC